MKACPACGRLYPSPAAFCPNEGARLTSVSEAPLPSHQDDRRIGRILCGRYEVRRVVADGGMSRVYEGLDRHERRSVALKILHREVALDPLQVARFEREFAVSLELCHPHIVEVHDLQPTPDGSYVLVMEFLYGEELDSTLQREEVLSPARLIRMVSQLALGVARAHAVELVHRDLKPANVFLCQTVAGDIVKILDLGSVKDRAEGAKQLTALGTTIGSPYYMAPEQAQGLASLDHRADVWSLAAIAYECITGKVPFSGPNGPSILQGILTQEAEPPSSAGVGAKYPVPAAVDDVIARAFRKTAAARTESVGKFADELGGAYGLAGDHRAWAYWPDDELARLIAASSPSLGEEPGQSQAASGTRVRWGVSMLGGALVLLLLSVLVFWLR